MGARATHPAWAVRHVHLCPRRGGCRSSVNFEVRPGGARRARRYVTRRHGGSVFESATVNLRADDLGRVVARATKN
eukprot:scaffold61941_cov57-Phaeocystis_antarctica.AAC.8